MAERKLSFESLLTRPLDPRGRRCRQHSVVSGHPHGRTRPTPENHAQDTSPSLEVIDRASIKHVIRPILVLFASRNACDCPVSGPQCWWPLYGLGGNPTRYGDRLWTSEREIERDDPPEARLYARQSALCLRDEGRGSILVYDIQSSVQTRSTHEPQFRKRASIDIRATFCTYAFFASKLLCLVATLCVLSFRS